MEACGRGEWGGVCSRMFEARDIALALPELHAKLNAVRPRPIRVEEFPGARVGVLPGQDSPFASATKNRVTVYDPGAADLAETLRAAREVYVEAGVPHWFAEIGPGATVGQIAGAAMEVGARGVPYVRYPVLVREPGRIAPRDTTLEIRRVNSDEARSHQAELDAIWDRPGGSAAVVNAANREGYAVVLGLCDGRAVAMGMVIAGAGGAAYLCSGGTHKDYRGRGGQSAIIAERVRIAGEMGCRVCISETVSAVMTSENNLRSAGFELAFEWTMLEVGTVSVG